MLMHRECQDVFIRWCITLTGGMGIVYRAWDAELDRIVAYKVIRRELCTERRAVEKFVSEARLTVRLKHPGVVAVHALTSDADGRLAYAMRFVDGGTPILDAVEQFHASRPKTANSRSEWHPLVQHLIRACHTIAHAHSIGIVHRDIAPRNILVAGDAETLVVDWGLAIDLAQLDHDSEEVTRARGAPTRAGTVPYVAPEVFEESRQHALGTRTDIYSLGAVLFLVLTGNAPFSGGNTPEVVEQVRRGPTPNAEATGANVPPLWLESAPGR